MKYLKYLFLFFLIFNNFALANKIKGIVTNGLETISRGTVLNYLPVEVGDNFSVSDSQNILRALYKTNFFSKISLEVNKDKDILVFDFLENPTIKYFDFIGYEEDKVLNQEVVEKIIKNYDFQIGKIFIDSKLNKLINEIKSLYSFNGYNNTKIEVEKKIDTKNRIGLVVNINEGSPALISSIKISGNTKISEDEILDLLEIGEPDFFLVNFFTERDKFSKFKLEQGVELIKSKYLELGFLDFEIKDTDLIFNKETNKLDITLFLNEGNQFRLGEINFSGDKLNFSNDHLRNFFKIKNGEIFERSKIVQGLKELSENFYNIGYAYADIKSSLKIAQDNNSVNVDINIQSDKRVYLNRIVISGNNTTQDDVIRRQIGLNESEIYSKEQITNSIKKIKRLGYFSDVNYEIKRLERDADKVDLFIDVVETKTGEFSIGLSHSNSTGAAINAGITQKNILGTGNVLKAAISNSDALKETSLFFENPYFNNLGHAISYGFFDRSLNAENIEASSYVFNEQGFSFGYGVPISENSSFKSDIRTSFIDLTCGSDLKNLYESEDCSSNDELDLSLSFTYKSSSLDDFYFPTEGSRSAIKTVLGLPFSDFKYIQFEVSNKNYSTIMNDKVVGFNTKINYVTSYGSDDLPFFKRYYGGGASSVRGFDFNSLGAKYTNDKPKGGELSWVSSAGITSKMNFLGVDNDNMRITGFIDSGTISEKISDFNVDDIRASYGVQFSWLTPIGPIGLNFAQPLLKKSDDKTETFAFELGSSF